MLPNNTVSSTPMPGEFLYPDSLVQSRLVDWEKGGADLNDSENGLMVKDWRGFLVGEDIYVETEGVAPTLVLSAPGARNFSIAFDQNMRVYVSYGTATSGFLWWFDTLENKMVLTEFAGAKTPRLCMDDKRALQSASNDVILAYIREGSLYWRQQRDRFQTERLAAANCGGRLRNIGMTRNGRLQFLVA